MTQQEAMNLERFRTVDAGGPGPGRRPGDAMHEAAIDNGYRLHRTSGGGSERHYEHTGSTKGKAYSRLTVDNGGGWRHQASDRGGNLSYNNGSGSDSLRGHLEDFHTGEGLRSR